MAAPAQRHALGQAGLDSPPSDLLDRIAQLGFISQVDPFWDRGDLLHQACTLACVGNAACTELARKLFAALSPRLGSELPDGVSDRSTAKQLKAALKECGLPTSGSKADLWARLLDEVQDSEVDEEGNPPRHCLVSGSTRSELGGWAQRRVSQSRCKEVYGLTKWDLSKLEHKLEVSSGSKTYLLSEVKQLAHRMYTSYEALRRQRAASKEEWERVKEDSRQRDEQRKDVIRAELMQRGHSAAEIKSILAASPGLSAVTWGSMSGMPAPEAASHLERLWFCVNTSERESMFAMNCASDRVQPPRSMSKYKAREALLGRAAVATLRWWSMQYSSLQAVQEDPAVPASLLPELEGLWEQVQAGPSSAAEAKAEEDEKLEGYLMYLIEKELMWVSDRDMWAVMDAEYYDYYY